MKPGSSFALIIDTEISLAISKENIYWSPLMVYEAFYYYSFKKFWPHGKGHWICLGQQLGFLPSFHLSWVFLLQFLMILTCLCPLGPSLPSLPSDGLPSQGFLVKAIHFCSPQAIVVFQLWLPPRHTGARLSIHPGSPRRGKVVAPRSVQSSHSTSY